MHLELKRQSKTGPGWWFSSNRIAILIAVTYAVGAARSAWEVVTHTQASTQAIEQILVRYNMQNESAQALERFDKENPLMGFFLSSPIEHNMELPSADDAHQAVYTDVKHLMKAVRTESSNAAWWSWFLLSLSLFYLVLTITLEGSFNTRPVIFSLAYISLVFFAIGVLAPAMVIWTAPSIPMKTGNLEFVLQHEVRGIAAIIEELLTTGHWVVGGFLLLFSIVTPLTKVLLTFFITACQSKPLNYKIGQFLHSIGKWSMADVFVAGILLAIYALKAQEATRSIPCLGLYYFIGYCLLSMTTTEVLVHSGLVEEREETPEKKNFGIGMKSLLLAGLLCFSVGSGLYTYQQYTLNTKQAVKASGSPQKLDSADLVLPAHK